MNPFVKTYIEQIHHLVEELSYTLENYEQELKQTQDAKETLLKQYWSAGRQISALQETLDRMPALEEENRTLREKNQASADSARRILAYAKALGGALQE